MECTSDKCTGEMMLQQKYEIKRGLKGIIVSRKPVGEVWKCGSCGKEDKVEA